MKRIGFSVATLLSGVTLLVLSLSLTHPAIGLQAAAADFSIFMTGLLMSVYFAGYVAGGFICPWLIRRVGHVRAFAALASLASCLPLLHALWLDPWFWGLLRFGLGVCVVGLFVVVESWLSAVAPSAQRGRVFAAYMTVSVLASAGAQWLILLGDTRGFTPFALASILMSFALLPLTLVSVDAPLQPASSRLPWRRIFSVSPVGAWGCIASGAVAGSFLTLGQPFAKALGWTDAQAATLVALALLVGALLQWPMGHWSDRRDRRHVLVWVCMASVVVGALAHVAMDGGARPWVLLLASVLGGFVFTLYTVCVAHANDAVNEDERLGLSAVLLLLYGIGSTAGPAVAGAVMSAWGPAAFPLFLSGTLLVLALWVLWALGQSRRVAQRST